MGRAGGPQRDERLRAYHRAEITKRYLLHHQSQREIAEALGISQQLVSLELRTVKEELLLRAHENVVQMFVEELVRLRILETEYWAGWARSQMDLVTLTFKLPNESSRTTSFGVARESQESDVIMKQAPPMTLPAGAKLVAHKRTRRDGNPKFLEGVHQCIAMRVRLFGLDKPHVAGSLQRQAQNE